MYHCASLALALLVALLLAASTNAQHNNLTTITVAADGVNVALLEQLYGNNLTQCSPQLSSNLQFLTAYANCQNDPAVFYSSAFPSYCPNSCQQMSNIVGNACVEQYLNLLASIFTQASQVLANNSILDQTLNDIINGMISAFDPSAPSTNSSLSLAQTLSDFANYYASWANVCAKSTSASSPFSFISGSTSQASVSGFLVPVGMALSFAMLLA
jgi:hypothetical protein